jgi:hypothetical protein
MMRAEHATRSAPLLGNEPVQGVDSSVLHSSGALLYDPRGKALREAKAMRSSARLLGGRQATRFADDLRSDGQACMIFAFQVHLSLRDRAGLVVP